MNDPARALVRRLQQGCASSAVMSIQEEHSRPWTTILFDGSRHRIGLLVTGCAVDETIERLQSMVAHDDLSTGAHLVAEIRLTTVRRDGQEARVILDALVIRA